MSNKSAIQGRSVYVVDGKRTPLLKAKGRPGPFMAADLAVYAGRELLAKQPFAPSDLDEVIIGCVMPRETEANIGRIIALRLGCGKKVPGWTVQRNCASGMQAVDSAVKDIAMGRHELVLAGGTEAMSSSPLLLNNDMVNWLADLSQAKNIPAKLKMAAKFRPKFLKPIIGLLHGLTDPVVGDNMGQTAENLAYQFKITREAMDEFALRSHARLASAQDKGYLTDVVPLYDAQGKLYAQDDGVRRDTTLEKLGKLKPFFDRKFGQVTAGNSSQVTDGAALMILASAEAVKKYQLPVIAKIVDVNWAALAPEVMGLGPVFATTPMLQRQQMQLSDVDYWEINEAFAVQVLGCLAAWKDKEFCKQQLDLSKAFGEIDQERLNVDGGAIAMGHPVGCSGARIILRLIDVLKRNNAKKGVATICIGGGQGGAMLIENVDSIDQ